MLYLWDLAASGYANTYNAAAVQAGTQSWKAWPFGSMDTSNVITVDKAARRAVDHGAVRADLRLQLLVVARPAATDGLTASTTRWTAATVSAQSASGLELASGSAVMAIGGFTGSDAAPSLAQFQAQFQAYVAAGDIHRFVASGPGGGPGGDADSVGSQISAWIAAHYAATTVRRCPSGS